MCRWSLRDCTQKVRCPPEKSVRTSQCPCCRMCFLRLKLLLIAIEARGAEETAESCIAINPGPNIKIEPNTQGFFIAQSADEVKRCVGSSFIENISQKTRGIWCCPSSVGCDEIARCSEVGHTGVRIFHEPEYNPLGSDRMWSPVESKSVRSSLSCRRVHPGSLQPSGSVRCFRACYFCKQCHGDVADVRAIKKCRCKTCKCDSHSCARQQHQMNICRPRWLSVKDYASHVRCDGLSNVLGRCLNVIVCEKRPVSHVTSRQMQRATD